MAMNFRRQINYDATEGEVSAPSVFTVLSTVFLGFAAIWLLAGAWSEIFLHGGAHAHTLYVFSALVVAGILGLIARTYDWSISRYFALVPQVLAALVFLW